MTAFAAVVRLSDVTARAGPSTSGRVIQTPAWRRKHLGMNVAFPRAVVRGRRWFEFVYAGSWCARFSRTAATRSRTATAPASRTARPPQLVRDATREPAVADLPATTELTVGAHLSVRNGTGSSSPRGRLRPVHAAFMAEMVAATLFGIQRTEMLPRLGMTDSEAYAELATLVVHTLSRSGPGVPGVVPGLGFLGSV